MNAEHYEKVRRVVAASEAALKQTSSRVAGAGDTCLRGCLREVLETGIPKVRSFGLERCGPFRVPVHREAGSPTGRSELP